MYDDRIVLTPQDILDKDFKVDARGYRPQEVDKFLDTIMDDYTKFTAIIKKQEGEIRTLSSQNAKLKQEYQKLRSRLEVLEEADEGVNNSVNNVDILRRISQLEKIVYGKRE